MWGEELLEESSSSHAPFFKNLHKERSTASCWGGGGSFGLASFERQGAEYEMQLRKVYPEVRNGQFKADFRFSGAAPENIRSGQTYYLNLQLGEAAEAILIPRGSFYQATGGRWIYVVDASGEKAYRREIRIGRQNPQYYEVIEGLQPGEKVITSSYDNFGENEVLILNK